MQVKTVNALTQGEDRRQRSEREPCGVATDWVTSDQLSAESWLMYSRVRTGG